MSALWRRGACAELPLGVDSRRGSRQSATSGYLWSWLVAVSDGAQVSKFDLPVPTGSWSDERAERGCSLSPCDGLIDPTEDRLHTLRYDAGAGAYDRLTGRWSRMYVDPVLDAARVREGSHVLDVATGTGDAAIAASNRVGRAGRVVAVDISVPMLQEASHKASGRAIEFTEGDAQRLFYADGSFDSIVCLFGLMFVPDKIAALGGFRRVLRPGGRVAATSWGHPSQAPFAGLVAEALAEQLPHDRADLLRPFSLADAGESVGLFRAAGFTDVSAELQTMLSPFASFEGDFWEPIEAGGGRLGQAYLGLSPGGRKAVRQRVLSYLPVRAVSEPFTLQHSAWVISAGAG